MCTCASRCIIFNQLIFILVILIIDHVRIILRCSQMQTRGILVDYRAVNSAMSACAKALKWDMVLKLYDQMPTVTGHTYIPNQFSYFQALNAACKLKSAKRTLEILYAKKAAGFVPSTASVSQVIALLEQGEQFDAAVSVFEQFISQHLGLKVS